MKRLLVVDDEIKIRLVIREYAEFNDFEVMEAEDGEEAVEICKTNDFDLIIMDIMMPKLDGFSACKEIKKFKNIPTILLSARNDEYDKLYGFELGIDDYVTKPFSPKELFARANAVVTRHQTIASTASAPVNVPKEEAQYTFQGLSIDTQSRTVVVDGEKIELTPKEYDLLVFLVENQGTALSRDVLLQEIWGYDFYGEDRTIDTHIKNLRNGLGPYRDFIVTLRGVGYKFEA